MGTLTFAQTTLVKPSDDTSNDLQLTWGGDIRFRAISENNFPNEKHGQKTDTDYTRFRTRLWGKATYNKLEAFLRIGNEFRYYASEKKDKGKQRFPDVTYIDNLYLRYKDEDIEIKIGRQDMSFGAKRIISDGTGGDGSRTTFFDAIRTTLQFEEKRKLDLFAIYMARHDWMPSVGRTHDAKSKGTKGYDYDLTGYNHNEYGIGAYYTDESLKELPWEAYYIWKCEEGEHSTVYDTAESGNTFQTHTIGFRLLPQFTKELSGELEASLQVGDESLFAGMAYAGMTYKRTDWQWKPAFTCGIQYMSGDKEGGRGDTAWHPVFNRETGVGDSIAPMFDKYAYNNFLYPHFKLSCAPTEKTTLSAETGPMFAPTDEVYKAERYGNFRGYFVKAKYSLAIGEMLQDSQWGSTLTHPNRLKDLVLSLSAEYLSKGNYFADDANDDALFFQLELTYKF
ncbi:MAG: alginate export family protein [bacterium]|nr:alginate export family protein [bacterium]